MGGFILGELDKQVSGQPEAQPVERSLDAKQPVQESPLSAEKVAEIVNKSVQDAMGAYERQQQGLRKKQESRIEQRLQAYEAAMRQINGDQELTGEQRNQLRTMARTEVEAELNQPPQEKPSPGQEAQPDKKNEQPLNPVEKLILKKFEKAGITIEDDDPELADLKDIDPYDLDELKVKIDTAIEKKKARLQGKPSNLNPDAAARVSAAMVTGLPGNPIANITDPTTLLTMGLTKKK